MTEIRNVNIDKEFIVKFGVCRTNISDDMVSIALDVLPKAIKEVLQETIVEDGEITVTPVKHGHWESNEYLAGIHMTRCSECKTEFYIQDLEEISGDGFINFCPNCGAKMDGGDNE